MDLWVSHTEDNYLKLLMAFKQLQILVFDMTKKNFLNHPEITLPHVLQN